MLLSGVKVKQTIRTLRTLSLAIAAPLLLAQPAFAMRGNHSQLPDIGTAGLSALSLEKEREVGKLAMRQIRGSYPMLYDPALQEYLETLGYRIANRGSTAPLHPFTFFLINEPSINAFAFFGGHVGVHTGLFMAADSESEVASVLAHEIAHVNQRHLARSFERQMMMQPATLGATIGAVLLTILAPQVGIAALQTSMAASQQMSINFTRKNEAEADRIGMQSLVAAGFDPYAMPAFFAKLAAKYRFAPKPPAFLLTHPLPESRVADSQLRAQQYPRKHYPYNPSFQFAKARVLVRYSKQEAKNLIQQFTYDLLQASAAQRDNLEYGLALAYFANHQFAEAKSRLAPLFAKYPRNLFLIDTATDIDMAQQHSDAAKQRLMSLYRYMPDNQVVAINYANVLLETGDSSQSIEVLKKYLRSRPHDMTALGLLESAYGKAEMVPAKYSTGAEILALMGRYEQAITMIERALKATPFKNRIETVKLEETKRIYRQQLIAARSAR